MTIPGAVRTGFLVSAVLWLALLAIGPAGARAQEAINNPVNIRGTVATGTQDSTLPPEIPVLLLVSDTTGGLVATDQTTTSQEGRFSFDQVPQIEGATYALSVDYAGIFYSTSLNLRDVSDEVRLTVYEPTQDASVVTLTRLVMVIAEVDEKNREIAALELVQLANNSDRTLVPDLQNPEQLSFLRFALPARSTDLNVRSDLPGGRIVSIDTGFALTSSVTPGDHSLEYSFRFPYRGDRVSYRQSLPQGAEVYQILVPERLAGVEVGPLQSIAPVNIGTSTYLAWEGRDFAPGQGVNLELTNLPQPGLWARLENSIIDGTFWQIAIPSALGLVLAFLLLFGAFKAPGREAGTVDAGPDGFDVDRAQHDSLVREVAVLDERFQQGAVEEADYLRQREDLVGRVLGPADPTGGDDLEPPEEPSPREG